MGRPFQNLVHEQRKFRDPLHGCRDERLERLVGRFFQPLQLPLEILTLFTIVCVCVCMDMARIPVFTTVLYTVEPLNNGHIGILSIIERLSSLWR